MDDSGLAAALGFLISFGFIFIIIGIVWYVINALALYTMAKNKGITHAWLAWIPIAYAYLEGEIIEDKVAIGDNIIPYASLILPLAPFAVGLLSFLPVAGWILGILYAVYYYFALYRLYKLYKPNNAVLYLVLSIVFTITTPFFLYSMRNNTPQEYL